MYIHICIYTYIYIYIHIYYRYMFIHMIIYKVIIIIIITHTSVCERDTVSSDDFDSHNFNRGSQIPEPLLIFISTCRALHRQSYGRFS